MSATPCILVIEDHPGAPLSVRLALERLEEPLQVVTAPTSVAATQVHRECVPDLILLDLSRPGQSGPERLVALRAQPELRTTPILVFTSAAAPVDIVACYAAGANSCFVKPDQVDEFQPMLALMVNYWFRMAALPPAPHRGVP
jgi:CheY-like chemotaxis protein